MSDDALDWAHKYPLDHNMSQLIKIPTIQYRSLMMVEVVAERFLMKQKKSLYCAPTAAKNGWLIFKLPKRYCPLFIVFEYIFCLPSALQILIRWLTRIKNKQTLLLLMSSDRNQIPLSIRENDDAEVIFFIRCRA